MTIEPHDITTVSIRALALERAKDEMHLRWLRLIDKGWSQRKIANRFGTSYSNVSMTLVRIRADLKKSEAKA